MTVICMGPAAQDTHAGGGAGPRWVLEELQRNLAAELDFRLEAANAQRLAATMARTRSVAVPMPLPEVQPCGPSELRMILLGVISCLQPCSPSSTHAGLLSISRVHGILGLSQGGLADMPGCPAVCRHHM